MKPTNFLLLIIGAGIWVLVLQNAGVIDSNQNVYVDGGFINADVEGSVDVENTVDVNVDNRVDVNLKAINGHEEAFYDHTYNHPNEYYRIPVYTGM